MLRQQQGPRRELVVVSGLQLGPSKGFKWGSDRYATGHDFRSSVLL